MVTESGEASQREGSSVHDRFTQSAQRALVQAGEEARGLGHSYVGTEHLLLGLLKEPEGAAVRTLEALEIAPRKVRERVIHVVGSYEADTEERRRPLTPKVLRTLECASEEALHLGHDYVGPGHLLLGLIRESKGTAAQVLYRLGAQLEEVRQEVVRIDEGWERVAGSTDQAGNLSQATAFQARVEGLVVRARCGATDEERARPQPLRVDLNYLYEAGEGDNIEETVDYATVIEDVARLLEREEFLLLETGARRVGEHVLGSFSLVREVTVAVTKLEVPVGREVSGVSVEVTFSR